MNNKVRPLVEKSRRAITKRRCQCQRPGRQHPRKQTKGNPIPAQDERRRINGNVKVVLVVVLLVDFFSDPIGARVQQVLVHPMLLKPPKDHARECDGTLRHEIGRRVQPNGAQTNQQDDYGTGTTVFTAQKEGGQRLLHRCGYPMRDTGAL